MRWLFLLQRLPHRSKTLRGEVWGKEQNVTDSRVFIVPPGHSQINFSSSRLETSYTLEIEERNSRRILKGSKNSKTQWESAKCSCLLWNFSSWKLIPSSLRWRLNKEVLVASMKTGLKGAQKNTAWRTMTCAHRWNNAKPCVKNSRWFYTV